jgi:hypothetical protein
LLNRGIEEGPEDYTGDPNGINTPVYDDSEDNVVYMNGERKEPNLLTLLLPNELEQKLRVDDTLEQWDADIEDFFEKTMPNKLVSVQTDATQWWDEVKKESKSNWDELNEGGEEIVTDIVDYIAHGALDASTAISDGMAKLGDSISSGVKTAASRLADVFKIKARHSLSDDTYSHYLDVVNN